MLRSELLREVVALECGSLLPLSFSGSLLPGAARASSSRKSGSKLPHSKALLTTEDTEAILRGRGIEVCQHILREGSLFLIDFLPFGFSLPWRWA